MAQEDFLKRLWYVLRHSSPVGRGNSPAGDGPGTRRPPTGPDHWFSPDTVEGYDPGAFADWSDATRNELTAAVGEFRTAVTAEERGGAAERLDRIVTIVRPVVRGAWVAAVDGLIGQAETWSRSRDWATRRFPKTLDDPLLGRFEVPELLIHLPEGRFILNPVSRFVAGGTGLVDMYVMPDLGGRSVVRRATGWEILPAGPRGRARPWSEAALADTVQDLLRQAA